MPYTCVWNTNTTQFLSIQPPNKCPARSKTKIAITKAKCYRNFCVENCFPNMLIIKILLVLDIHLSRFSYFLSHSGVGRFGVQLKLDK